MYLNLLVKSQIFLKCGGISGMQVSWNTKIGVGPNHGMVIQNSIQFYMNFKKDKKSDSSTKTNFSYVCWKEFSLQMVVFFCQAI